jgi:exoribonuclease R
MAFFGTTNKEILLRWSKCSIHDVAKLLLTDLPISTIDECLMNDIDPALFVSLTSGFDVAV